MSADTVVLVGDPPAGPDPVRAALERLGYRVEAAGEVEAALALVRAHLPGAVVVDCAASGVDGLEVCRQLRRDPLTTAAFIIALASAAPGCPAAARAAGADDVLARPLDPNALRACLGAPQPGQRRVSRLPRAQAVGIADLLAHDLKSPLSIVIGALELLAQKGAPGDSDAANRLIGSALEAARRQMQMIDELVDLSRLEAGALDYAIEAVSLADVVDDALYKAADGIAAKRLAVINRVPAGLPPVAADSVLLRRVLLSLIDNTLKFNLYDAQLTIDAAVDARADPPACVLTWVDGGRPVAPQYAGLIFERAIQWRARLDSSRTSVALGFPFCRAVLRLMGGDIAVRSTEDTTRTTFTLTLPVHLPAWRALA
ncbi:MAG: hybrid sensor histidine kinase/response regulator [Anaerolineae bacterium]|nr:hybrid sensor histidine kinase/response regulator [Anaerolineae bacterium]